MPYSGGIPVPCVVLKYVATAKAPDDSASVLGYVWYTDDGEPVAIVGAINVAGIETWDTVTGQITGNATFNALSSIGPY